MKAKQDQAPTRALASKVIFAAMQAIKRAGGELPISEVKRLVEQSVDFNDWERARYEKTGNVRWQALLFLFSIDSVKAGFLVKKKGIWFLTPKGEEALAGGEREFFSAASEGYKAWKQASALQDDTSIGTISDRDAGEMPALNQGSLTFESAEEQARIGIREHIGGKSPYEMQDMTAALLRSMGYHISFVAPPGRDGGVDIIAYRDPLGTLHPKIKVQVKHRIETPAPVTELRELLGLLSKDSDVGLFVSTGGFTKDAQHTARHSNTHIELIDLDRFIELWQEYFPKMTEEDQAHMPLLPIFFVAPEKS